MRLQIKQRGVLAKWSGRTLAVTVGMLFVFSLVASSANAMKVHPFEKEVALPVRPAAPNDIGINQATHHVYVTTNQTVVYNFGPDGTLDPVHPTLTGAGSYEPYGIAVDNSSSSTNGYIYTTEFHTANPGIHNTKIRQFDASGAATGVIISAASLPPNGTPQAGGLPDVINDGFLFTRTELAVGPSGHLFVADADHPGLIDEFTGAGTFVAQYPYGDKTKTGLVVGLAIGAAGQFYITSGGELFSKKEVYSLGPAGECLDGSVIGAGEEKCNPVVTAPGEDRFLSVAATGDGRFLVVRQAVVNDFPQVPNTVLEYDSTGTLVSTVGSGQLRRGEAGVVLDEATDRVYAPDAYSEGNETLGEGRLLIFGPTVVLPDAVTLSPVGVTDRGATLQGEIGADGGFPATCVFQYVDDAKFKATGFTGASEANCEPAGPFTSEAMAGVEGKVDGLQGGTTYHVRILTRNEHGENPGEGVEFKTAGPTVGGARARDISDVAATLEAAVDPRGAPAKFVFQYLTAASLEAHGWAAASEAPAAGGSIALGASGHGDLEAGSAEIRNVIAEAGTFAVGQTVAGPGIPADTTIVSVSPGTLTLSAPAAGTAGAATLTASKPATLSARAEGLAPATSYRFRIVATDTGASVEGETTGPAVGFSTFSARSAFAPCPNEALRDIGPSVLLPDCRAYEQASPLDKNGASVHGEVNAVQAAADGSAITFFSGLGIPGGEGAQNFPSYVASRNQDGSGWSTRGLLPPASTGPYGRLLGWSGDLRQVYSENKEVGSPANLYVREATNPIATVAEGEGSDREQFDFAAASDGGSQVLFQDDAAGLLPAAAPDKPNAYVWDRATDTVHLAGVMNDGSAPGEGAFAGAYDWFGSKETDKGSAENAYYLQDAHVISADGSRVFFTAAGSGQLYMRENPTAAQSSLDGQGKCTDPDLGCTILISESERSVPGAVRPAAFLGATDDGMRSFFLSTAQLTEDATGGPVGTGGDLYRYDVGGGLVDLTPDGADTNGAEVQGVLGMSKDGSYVYFAANGVLAAGARPGDCRIGLEAGECSVYLSHGGTIEFVARLRAQRHVFTTDLLDWSPTSNHVSGNEILENNARVSSDGQTLLFSSWAPLTSYDSEGHSELYRYRVGDGLACISCDPTGQPPTGNAYLQEFPLVLLGPRIRYGIKTRNLSQDGNRVFFETPDRLVLGDENHVLDVYEWEAKGSGSCSSEGQNGGCLYLISTGTGDQPAYFGDADDRGENVFFFTDARLVAQDRDELIDVYDARVDGGIAAQSRGPSVPCEVEACLGPAPVAPESGPVGSATFVGPGNPKPPVACPKGKVRRKGHCVKRRHKARRHHKARSHQKKHRARQGQGKGKAQKKRDGRSGGGLGR